MKELDYLEIRESLGLSQREMANELGLQGQRAGKAVFDIEVGKKEPTGPVRKLYEIFAESIKQEKKD